MADTNKGPWTLQQVRDQALKNCWPYTPVPPVAGSGSLFFTGYNLSGMFGNNSIVDSSSPVQLPGSWSTNKCSFALGYRAAVAIKNDGTLWVTGENQYGILGQNNNCPEVIGASSPVQVPGTTWCAVTASWTLGSTYGSEGIKALKTDGTLWAWGGDNYGAIGVNTLNVHRSSPVQIPGTWIKVKTAQNTLALKSDCSLWVWGRDYYGELGLSCRCAHKSSPTQLPGTWCDVAATFATGAAIKTDGTLWTWGGSTYGGILGLNDLIGRSSPTQVPGSNWCKICLGSNLTFGPAAGAIKTDGTLWVWGNNSAGNLGLNDTVYRSSPTQIPGSTWCDVSMGATSFAMKTDGSLYFFGANAVGEGSIDKIARSSPTQIPGTWNDAEAGMYYTSIKQN